MILCITPVFLVCSCLLALNMKGCAIDDQLVIQDIALRVCL